MGRPKKNSASSGPAQASTKKIPSLSGVFDVNTATDFFWDAGLRRFSKVARVYGFSRVEMPLVEDMRLYRGFYGNDNPGLQRLVGLNWDGSEVALRPSQLPGLLRNFFQQKLFDAPNLQKWHYAGFTAKKDLAGSPSLDYEFGCEILGTFNHLNEAHTIAAAWEFLSLLDAEGLVLEINNLGTFECQERYARVLYEALSPKKYELCESCNEILEVRPLGVFACENLDCRAVVSDCPTVLDFLDEDSHKDFTHVLEALEEMRIAYQLNPFYAGREFSEKTNFAIKYKHENKLITLAEGGHHSGAAVAKAGKNFGAFGFFGSLSAVKRILEASSTPAEHLFLCEVCLVPLGELAAKRSLRLFRDLTAEKILVYDHFGLSGVKNQLKIAAEHKVPIALIMGQKEAIDEMVILRDVKSGMQEIISYDKIVEEVKKRLGK